MDRCELSLGIHTGRLDDLERKQSSMQSNIVLLDDLLKQSNGQQISFQKEIDALKA